MIKTQVCIIGAGAGGIGCAYRLIKNGISTVIVDKNSDYGGTMTFGGVDGWEPGPTLDGLHSLLYEKMLAIENGCHVVKQVPNCNIFEINNGENWDKHSFKERPWGLALRGDYTYEETLKNATFGKAKRLQFEPSALISAVREVFSEHKKHLVEFFGYRYLSCEHTNDRISSVTIGNGKRTEEIVADFFVDATGDIVFARSAGCSYAIGSEGKDDYGEACAKKSNEINGVSYCFRISKCDDKEHIDSIPEEYRNVDLGEYEQGKMRKTVSCLVEYPNGDFNINMLPTLEGKEYFALGERADIIGKARVWAYWHFWQTEKNMKGYTLTQIYDAGIREGYRLKGRYVLKEQDLRAGILRQPKIGRTIAIADHAMDIHGECKMFNALDYPYEVPIECTMTNEYSNLFVSSRGASFTHIASSSVRLSRTILSIGEGVGEYLTELLFNKNKSE